VRPEKHFGTVRENADPEKTGALKVEVRTVMEGMPIQDDWIPGKFPFAGKGEGFYYVPPVGSLVEVEVEADSEAAVEDLDARWSSARYTRSDSIPEEFQSAATSRGGIKYGKEVFLQDKEKALTALISGKVRLGEENCAHPLVRGDTFNEKLSTYLTACKSVADKNVAQFTALSTAAVGPLAPLKAAFDLLVTAWTEHSAAVVTFKAELDTWLSTKCRTE